MDVAQQQVRFGDLAKEVQEIRPQIDEAVARVLSRGWFVLGEEGTAFESEFGAWLGGAHVAGCGNGTDAITLALNALGVGKGDEVITVANTCVPTAAGIRDAGCELKLVDCDPRTLQIDPTAVEAAITPRTRAVVAVHLYGNSCNLRELKRVCDAAGVFLVEDCAQAHGTMLDGRHVGTWGHIAAWSYYPSKNLGAYGDGGAVVSVDPALIESVKRLRNYGQRVRYYHDEEGRNSRLDEVQAAILRVKLVELHRWNGQRRKIAAVYENELRGLSASWPELIEGSVSSRHLFPILVDASKRDSIRQELGAAGVDCQIHYPVPLHKQKAYSALFPAMKLPHAEDAAGRLISLPIYPQLTEDEARHVAAAVKKIVG